MDEEGAGVLLHFDNRAWGAPGRVAEEEGAHPGMDATSRTRAGL